MACGDRRVTAFSICPAYHHQLHVHGFVSAWITYGHGVVRTGFVGAAIAGACSPDARAAGASDAHVAALKALVVALAAFAIPKGRGCIGTGRRLP